MTADDSCGDILLTSYLFFATSYRPSVTRSTYLTSVLSFATQLKARLLARQFRELPEKEAKKWTKKAEQDKIRYQEEMKHYVPAEDPTGGGGAKKKAKKDPNAPKRNMSAYFLFSIAERPNVKEENPTSSFGDIARITSARFKALTPTERKIWDDKAVADKERYLAAMEVYRG